MDKAQMEQWKRESIKQAEEELYGEVLASYSEMPFVGPNFEEGWL